MTALVAIHDTQGLIDGVIVGTCIVAILAIATWWDRKEQAHWNKPILVPDDLRILDHTRCAHIDIHTRQRCTTVLCFCIGLDDRGQPKTCEGTQTPACHHSLVSRATTGGHCSTHQRSCADCIAEDNAMFGSVS